MSIMITAYGQKAFYEAGIPMGVTQYEMELAGEITGLTENISLRLEFSNQVWYLRNTESYTTVKQRGIADGPLADGDFLVLTDKFGGKLTLLIRETGSTLPAYRRFELAGAQLVGVGSEANNQIIYQYQGLVSGQHTVFQRVPGGMRVQNSGSNGTYVNGRRITQPKDLIFGDCVDVFGLKMVYVGDALLVSSLSAFNLVPIKTHKVMLTYVMDHSQVYTAQFTTKILVGRAGGPADLQLPDDFVSERHCEIGISGDKFYIMDLGSSNGTYVNGSKIVTATQILSDCGIKLGSRVYKVTVE